MTYHGSSIDPDQEFKIHYKHIITPNTYEVVDEFVVTSSFKD